MWVSPIKEAPKGAKEFTMMLSGGLVRCLGFALMNEAGVVYDHVALYKSKKETEPYIVLEKGVISLN